MKVSKCCSAKIYYVQPAWEYHSVHSIKDGTINLLALEESVFDNSYTWYLECSNCGLLIPSHGLELG